MRLNLFLTLTLLAGTASARNLSMSPEEYPLLSFCYHNGRTAELNQPLPYATMAQNQQRLNERTASIVRIKDLYARTVKVISILQNHPLIESENRYPVGSSLKQAKKEILSQRMNETEFVHRLTVPSEKITCDLSENFVRGLEADLKAFKVSLPASISARFGL